MISGRIRLVLAIGLMPVLAAVAGIAALGNVLGPSFPDKAAALPLTNANAYADRTIMRLGAASPGRKAASPDSLLADGARTFQAEPTNAASISLIALSRQLAGDTAGARRLYKDALALSKRDKMANLWLIEDGSTRGQIGYVLDRYDVLLRTGGAVSDTLFDVLGTALGDEAIIPFLEQRLMRRPPWAEQFWLRVATHGAAIENIARLRIALAGRGFSNPAGNDGDIIRRLAEQKHYDLAMGLLQRISPRRPSNQIIHNPDFAGDAQYVPFDWELMSGSGYGAELDRGARALALFTEAGAETLLARQLVAASPGRYSLAARVRDPAGLAAFGAAIKVRCADAAAAVAVLPIAAATARGDITVPASCRFAWVEVWVRSMPTGSSSADDLLLDGVNMTRVP
jgi:hypothetical protein